MRTALRCVDQQLKAHQKKQQYGPAKNLLRGLIAFVDAQNKRTSALLLQFPPMVQDDPKAAAINKRMDTRPQHCVIKSITHECECTSVFSSSLVLILCVCRIWCLSDMVGGYECRKRNTKPQTQPKSFLSLAVHHDVERGLRDATSRRAAGGGAVWVTVGTC